WTKIAGKAVTFRCDSDVVITTGQKILVGFDPARGSLFNAETTNRI
ncbi:MAG: transporter ATP-binding protein, partial [Devosia sp.]|nr:transporter ATP-binding protein [Devosia sp.]